MIHDEPIKARELAPFVCGSGLKNFCAATGLDYQVMLREGYPADVLLATDDANADRIVALVLAAREARAHG